MVKYAPRKVYIRESGGYVELSYTEFCRCRESDQTYMDKLFIPIQGCMLMFLLEYQDQECVLEVFVWLETVLGQEAFKKLFPVILTDGGSEFSARKEMEEFCDGSKSTTIFYCDPYCFWQKGACEKNHEYIRYIRPKGSSFADLDDEKIMLMMNHINSEKRDSLNGHSPYELSLLLLDQKLHKALGLTAVAPDDVMLSPNLLK